MLRWKKNSDAKETYSGVAYADTLWWSTDTRTRESSSGGSCLPRMHLQASPAPGSKPSWGAVLCVLALSTRGPWLTELSAPLVAPGGGCRVTRSIAESRSLENALRASEDDKLNVFTALQQAGVMQGGKQPRCRRCPLLRAWFWRTRMTISYFCFRHFLLLKVPSFDQDSCARHCTCQSHPESHPVYVFSQQMFYE